MSSTKAHAPSRPIRVAVANDYPLVIAGAAQALGAHADQVTVVECVSRGLPASVVDVVLFDLFGHAQAQQQ